jgi:hypothetical protein
MVLPQAFWQKIDKDGPVPADRPELGPCWLWLGYKNARGYGRTTLSGRLTMVHRAVYEELVGPLPVGLDPDHLCMNPPCCNPSHIEPVTRSVNAKRGRQGEYLRKKQTSKTHCPKGHPYDEANTINLTNGRYGTPYRVCRECRREVQRIRARTQDRSAYFREYRARKRAQHS